MTKIPISSDPLVDMIDAVLVEQSNNEKPRNYLGASSIGDECARKLWYKLNGEKEYFDAKTIRRFMDGHDTEEKILGWIGLCNGIELYTHGDNGDQIGFGLFEERFSGHCDGIGKGFPQAPKTWHIVEVKCVNEKSYKEICALKETNEKTAIRLWKPEYYSQVQVYMHMEGLTRSLHIIATPGGRDLVSVRTEYDKDHAEAMLAKAKRIIDAREPPERIGDSSYYKCRMCFMRDKCHG